MFPLFFSLGSELVFNDVMFYSLFLQLCSFPFYSVVFIILFLSSHISELLVFFCVFWGFPCGSAKESNCNVGDLGSIPGLGKSPGEGKGY